MKDFKLEQYRVLVILPTYNRLPYLKQAIGSVLNQTYKNIELLVSDNSDNEKVRDYLEFLNDNRITYVRSGYGISPLEHAAYWEKYAQQKSHDFFTIFHDDDLMKKNHIKSSLKILIDNKGIKATSPAADIINEKGIKSGEKTNFILYTDRVIKGYWGVFSSCWLNPMIYPATVYRSTIKYSPVRLFARSVKGYFDYSGNILTIFNDGVIVSKKNTFSYRVHSGQDSVNFSVHHATLHRRARRVAIGKIKCNVFFKLLFVILFTIRACY